MDGFLTRIKDPKKKLIAVDEVLSDSSLVHTIWNGLPDQSFASTLCLMMKGSSNALSFEELVFVLLQEDQSRQNMSIMRADQVFWVSQRGKGKVGSSIGKPKFAYVAECMKEDKDEKKK